MGTIWVTGDIHGNPARLSSAAFPEQKNMTREDVVEILGDFGLVWEKEESPFEKYWLDWLEDKPFTTVATLGNHENYDRITGLPQQERFGAPVWVLRPHIYLLQSGYIYTINGKKIWNFNGARSHDIRDGILDGSDPLWKEKARQMSRQNKQFRVKGVSWWEQEIEQDPEVYRRGSDILEACGYGVDFVWTHCAPTSVASAIGLAGSDRLTEYFQEISGRLPEKTKWFFGHYHLDGTPEYHKYALYEQIIQIK